MSYFKKSEIVNIGKGEAIDDPQYDYLRKVDCSSGNSLLFNRQNAEGNLIFWMNPFIC
jgi:hypothetical protein